MVNYKAIRQKNEREAKEIKLTDVKIMMAIEKKAHANKKMQDKEKKPRFIKEPFGLPFDLQPIGLFRQPKKRGK